MKRKAKAKDSPPHAAAAVVAPLVLSPRRWTLLLPIALLALILRLVYVSQISHAPFSDIRLGDATAYHQWALRIAAGDWLGEEVFYQAPLYPYFLAVVYKVFGSGTDAVRLIQAAIGAGSCALLAAAGMALFGTYGALAGALLAIYPPAIFFDGLLEKSALVSFFTAALLYLLSVRGTKFRVLLAGTTLGLLSLTRENALLLALPVLLWFWMEERGTRQRWQAPAVFLAGCLLVLLPVGARNYAVGGEFHLTTSQFGPNFYIGNHAGARGVYSPLVPGRGNAEYERDDATRLAEEAEGRTLSPDEVSSFWTGRALEFIRAQPGAWLRQMARKLALTFNTAEATDTESQEVYAEWSPLLRILSPFGFGVVFCLAAFGAAMTAGDWRRLWFLYAIALTYTLSIVIFYIFARYRFPIVPALLLMAAGGAAAWHARTARQPARRWAYIAAVLAGVVAYLPIANEDARIDRASHYANIANAFLQDPGTLEQAAVFYERALKESPESPAANFGMGMVLAQKRQPQDAVARYRIAVKGLPENGNLRLNFALALADVGDNDGALAELEAAARLRPTDPTPHLFAGDLLLKQSRLDAALKAYEQALAIEPQNLDALTGAGLSLMNLDRPAEAAEKYRLALTISPSADMHNTFGWTLAASGQIPEAIQQFKQALALDPDDQNAQKNLELAESVLAGRR